MLQELLLCVVLARSRVPEDVSSILGVWLGLSVSRGQSPETNLELDLGRWSFKTFVENVSC